MEDGPSHAAKDTPIPGGTRRSRVTDSSPLSAGDLLSSPLPCPAVKRLRGASKPVFKVGEGSRAQGGSANLLPPAEIDAPTYVTSPLGGRLSGPGLPGVWASTAARGPLS